MAISEEKQKYIDSLIRARDAWEQKKANSNTAYHSWEDHIAKIQMEIDKIDSKIRELL